jgi:hypothetical protein
MFGEINTLEQAKALYDYMNATIEFRRNVTPKFVRINESYLNQMLKYGIIKQMRVDSGSYIEVSIENVISFHGIPVVIDNSIEDYEFVY